MGGRVRRAASGFGAGVLGAGARAATVANSGSGSGEGEGGGCGAEGLASGLRARSARVSSAGSLFEAALLLEAVARAGVGSSGEGADGLSPETRVSALSNGVGPRSPWFTLSNADGRLTAVCSVPNGVNSRFVGPAEIGTTAGRSTVVGLISSSASEVATNGVLGASLPRVRSSSGSGPGCDDPLAIRSSGNRVTRVGRSASSASIGNCDNVEARGTGSRSGLEGTGGAEGRGATPRAGVARGGADGSDGRAFGNEPDAEPRSAKGFPSATPPAGVERLGADGSGGCTFANEPEVGPRGADSFPSVTPRTGVAVEGFALGEEPVGTCGGSRTSGGEAESTALAAGAGAEESPGLALGTGAAGEDAARSAFGAAPVVTRAGGVAFGDEPVLTRDGDGAEGLGAAGTAPGNAGEAGAAEAALGSVTGVEASGAAVLFCGVGMGPAWSGEGTADAALGRAAVPALGSGEAVAGEDEALAIGPAVARGSGAADLGGRGTDGVALGNEPVLARGSGAPNSGVVGAALGNGPVLGRGRGAPRPGAEGAAAGNRGVVVRGTGAEGAAPESEPLPRGSGVPDRGARGAGGGGIANDPDGCAGGPGSSDEAATNDGSAPGGNELEAGALHAPRIGAEGRGAPGGFAAGVGITTPFLQVRSIAQPLHRVVASDGPVTTSTGSGSSHKGQAGASVIVIAGRQRA